jgi:ribosomal protein S18 acetylase RimI-like enzyme
VSDASSRERIRRFEREMQRLVSSRIETFRWGTAYFESAHPLVWDLNFLDLEATEVTFTADDVIAEANAVQGAAGLGHRRIMVDDATVANTLEPRFRELGWMVNRFVFMELRREPTTRHAPRRAREIDRDTHRRAYARTTTEAPYGSEPEVVRQLADQTDLIASHCDVRYFGGVDDDGTVASVCVVYSDGEIAQIEDVATLKDYRRRGLANELLSLAIHEAKAAGHELIFLVADMDDWPKDLYARLGFDPIGEGYDFVLPGDVVYRNDDGDKA